MIEAKTLSKAYGTADNRFVALDAIDLTIADGATIAIVGKSGSGKSTLMQILSGLDRPTEGTVVIDGADIFKMKPRVMDAFRTSTMSFIFQSFFVEANQTCFQNVMLPLEIAGIARADRKKLVLDALESVELEGKADSLAANLSGGQKQRLAIARAIVNRPRILFADEPTGNLDSVTGEKIMQLLFDLNKQLGCTLVLVTHDSDLADRCHRQIHLKDGKLVASNEGAKGKRVKTDA